MSSSGPMPRSATPDPVTNGHGRPPMSASGSTPRIKVTRFSPLAGPIAERLFRDTLPQKVYSELSRFGKLEIWQRALAEAIVTGLWSFGSILIICGSALWGTSLPGRTNLVTGALHALMFIIYLPTAAGSVAEQGTSFRIHLNPAVTVMLMLRGFNGPVFSLIIIIGQCVGCIFAGLAAKELVLVERRDQFLLGGCFHKRTILTNGVPTLVGFTDAQGFLADFMFSFSFLYVSLMLTHPKQLKVVGIKLVIFIIGLNSGFNIYISGTLRQGYSGSMYNPARCLGSALAYGQPLWDRLWVPFLAPLVASVAAAAISYIAPPDYVELFAEKRDVFSKLRRELARSRRGSERVRGRGRNNNSNDDHEAADTVYEIPSGARRFADGPDTPDLERC